MDFATKGFLNFGPVQILARLPSAHWYSRDLETVVWIKELRWLPYSDNNEADGQFWAVIDTLMPIVMGMRGCRMCRRGS